MYFKSFECHCPELTESSATVYFVQLRMKAAYTVPSVPSYLQAIVPYIGSHKQAYHKASLFHVRNFCPYSTVVMVKKFVDANDLFR